jgi:hypothetical protein
MTMKKFLAILFFLSVGVFSNLSAQSGCPGCMIDLPDLPEDTIYLSPAPDGQVGEYYEEDISFRMPKTTTPVAAVDPDVVPDVAIESITILSVTNVPPRLKLGA